MDSVGYRLVRLWVFIRLSVMNQQNIKKKFIELHTTESDKLFRYCFLRVSDRQTSLDMVQDSFVRLWNVIVQEKEIVNMRSFLFRIAHNLVVDWYRKKKAISLDSMTDREDGELGFQIVDESQVTLDIGAEGRMFLKKIKDLNETYRHVVYLRFVEDLSPKEISLIVDLDVNTVSVRINRGIKELRSMLHINII